MNQLVAENKWEVLLSAYYRHSIGNNCDENQRIEIAALLIEHLWLSEARFLLSMLDAKSQKVKNLINHINSIENPAEFIDQADHENNFHQKLVINCLSRENRYSDLLDFSYEILNKPQLSHNIIEALTELCKFYKSSQIVELAKKIYDKRNLYKRPECLAAVANAALWCAENELFQFVKADVEKLSELERQSFFALWGSLNENQIENDCNEFIDIRFSNNGAKPDIELVTILYGNEYTKNFINYCLSSLLSSKGFLALSSDVKIVWSFYTTPDFANTLGEIIRHHVPSEFSLRINTRLFHNADQAQVLRGYAFKYSMKRCIDSGTTLLLVSPDLIFGDGLSDLIHECPSGGIGAAHHFRVFDQSLFDAWKPDGMVGLLDYPNKNEHLLKNALTNLSLYWTRATLLNKKTRSPERRVIFSSGSGENLVTSYHACPVALVFKPNIEMYDEVENNQGWWYGPRPERWMNSTDHHLPWHYAKNNKIYLPKNVSEFFFVEINSANGYSRIIKTIRGIKKNDIEAVMKLGVSFTDPGIFN